MSFDTAKENDSVVDSSVTEWKPDVENRNNQESPEDKVDEDAYNSGAEDQGHSCEQVGTSNANKRSKSSDTRYFIIKSLNHENIQLSIEKGIWATQVMNEPILEEAYHNSGKVILIFSVNMSGFFQGYAQMMSSVGWRRDNVWSNVSGGPKPWGRSFKVKWLRLHDLPFQKTLHLKNPLNHYKPVKISRDCQELPRDIGEALCELLDGEIGVSDYQTSYDFNMDSLLQKGPFIETSCALRDEEYDADPMHMSFGSASTSSPSMLYQHSLEASRFLLAQHRPAPAAPFHNIPKAAKTTFIKGSVRSADMDVDSSSQFGSWDLSAERSVHGSCLTDDDILEMTYEEYLEAHARGKRFLHQPVGEPFRRSQESSISKELGDDSHTQSSKKRSRHHHDHDHQHGHHRTHHQHSVK